MRKLLLLLYLCPSILFGQAAALDSLERRFAAEPADTQKLELLSQMTGIAFDNDFQQALGYAKRGVALAEKTGNPDWQPKFYEMQGRMHANLSQLDSARLFFDRAMAGYRATGNKKGQATTHFKIAWVHKHKGEIEAAMAADLQALRLMEELGDQAGIAGALGRVSEDLRNQERSAEALDYARRAIGICQKNNFQQELPYALRYAGDACIAMGDNAQALHYYTQALDLTRSLNGSPINVADIINCRGNALKRLGRYTEALQDYQVCLTNSEKANYPGGVFTALANLGEVNLLLGKYAEALPYQLKTIELQEQGGDLANLTENYGHASTIYEQLGDFPSALLYQKKARQMRDSMASVQSDAAISELRTRYETEKKEATIAAQGRQISQQQLVQWLSIGVAALLAALLFFLFRSYRLRTRTNRLLAAANAKLEAKNQENQLLLKEIHHRVKNNLQTISSLLNLQSAGIADANALEAVRESQGRVRSMALIHQNLYQGENLAAVEMKGYFETLGQAMLHSFGPAGQQVALNVAMNELEMDVDTAIPLGLIANELLTNALKYAFPENQAGAIEISLTPEPDHQFCLRIADNGVGLSDNGAAAPPSTQFGSQLVQLLAIQLNGRVERQTTPGLATLVRFKPLSNAA